MKKLTAHNVGRYEKSNGNVSVRSNVVYTGFRCDGLQVKILSTQGGLYGKVLFTVTIPGFCKVEKLDELGLFHVPLRAIRGRVIRLVDLIADGHLVKIPKGPTIMVKPGCVGVVKSFGRRTPMYHACFFYLNSNGKIRSMGVTPEISGYAPREQHEKAMQVLVDQFLARSLPRHRQPLRHKRKYPEPHGVTA